MDASVTKRRWQPGKKPELCKLRLLSTIIRGREQSDQESVNNGKIALAHQHNWAPITSTSVRGVARTSVSCLGHPARAGFCFGGVLVCFPPLTTLAHTCWCSYQGQFKKRARNTLRKAYVWVRASLRCNRHVWTTWTTLAHTHWSRSSSGMGGCFLFTVSIDRTSTFKVTVKAADFVRKKIRLWYLICLEEKKSKNDGNTGRPNLKSQQSTDRDTESPFREFFCTKRGKIHTKANSPPQQLGEKNSICFARRTALPPYTCISTSKNGLPDRSAANPPHTV